MPSTKETMIPNTEIKPMPGGFVRYVDHMGDDQRIVEAARVSYLSPSKGEEQDKRLLNYLFRNKHTSPFEMGKITFNIRLPIFVMRQFVRHRMQNLNEVSARYTELEDEFHVPETFRGQSKHNKQCSEERSEIDQEKCQKVVDRIHRETYAAYQQLLKEGVAREQARIVLPVSIFTEIYSCWDINNLIKFLREREHPHAQQEIRVYASAMKEIARQLFPWTIEAYENERRGY